MACGVETVNIAVLRRYNAVRSHQNRTVKARKFFCLLPPGVAVIAYEMAVLLESRIIVGRQHLAVCVHIHSGAFRLLQQRFHILQVMPADQNTRTGSYTDVHFGDFRVAVSRCIRPVQQRHDRYAHFPAFQHQCSQLVAAKRVIQH
ncbi:hypothetical protein D3C85_1310240 [compost metagenome]